MLGAERLAAVVGWARRHGIVVASDECYLEFGWEGPPPVSVLHPSVCGGSHEGLLAVHSLSKRSNLAGYRAGLLAGDPVLVGGLLEVRRHLGLLDPGPVQAAAVAALDDDTHVEEQRARYLARRALLRDGLAAAGFVVEHSEAGLYLWCGTPTWTAGGRWTASPGWACSPRPARSTVRRAAPTCGSRSRRATARWPMLPAGCARPDRPGRGRPTAAQSLACRAAFSSMPVPLRGRASSAPVTELRQNSRSSTPDSSRALTTRPSGRVIFEPAVM